MEARREYIHAIGRQVPGLVGRYWVTEVHRYVRARALRAGSSGDVGLE